MKASMIFSPYLYGIIAIINKATNRTAIIGADVGGQRACNRLTWILIRPCESQDTAEYITVPNTLIQRNKYIELEGKRTAKSSRLFSNNLTLNSLETNFYDKANVAEKYTNWSWS